MTAGSAGATEERPRSVACRHRSRRLQTRGREKRKMFFSFFSCILVKDSARPRSAPFFSYFWLDRQTAEKRDLLLCLLCISGLKMLFCRRTP